MYVLATYTPDSGVTHELLSIVVVVVVVVVVSWSLSRSVLGAVRQYPQDFYNTNVICKRLSTICVQKPHTHFLMHNIMHFATCKM